MVDLCLPLSAGEGTFELHLVELEAVEKQICELLGNQAQLRERRPMLEISRADVPNSGVSMQRAANTLTTSTLCVSLHRPRAPRKRSSQISFTPAPGNHGPWVQQTRARHRGDELSSSAASDHRDIHPKLLFSSPQEGTWHCVHRCDRPARPCYVSWR